MIYPISKQEGENSGTVTLKTGVLVRMFALVEQGGGASAVLRAMGEQAGSPNAVFPYAATYTPP